MKEPRNTLRGFVQRTRKNLKYVKSASGRKNASGEYEAHVVTQVLTSLLGLVVLPYEGYPAKQDKNEAIRNDILKYMQDVKLVDHPWSNWKITCDEPNSSCDNPGPSKKQADKETNNLERLLFHVRNAVSHGRFMFEGESPLLSPNSPNLADVKIKVADAPGPTHGKGGVMIYPPINWRAEINGKDLYGFCLQLAEYIDRKAEELTN